MKWVYFERVQDVAMQDWLSQWAQSNPGAGVLVYVPEAEQAQVAWVQQCARSQGVAVAGAVFPELIVQGRFVRQGVLLLGLDPMPPFCLLGGLSQPDGRAHAVQTLTAWADAQAPQTGTLALVFDGLFGQTASFLTELYRELGDACRYAGVNAGSESFAPMPCVFNQDRCLTDAVLALWLPHPAGAVVQHGYTLFDTAAVAGASVGNRVVRVGGQSAFDFYAALVREHGGQEVTRENFYSFGVHFPFALVRASGESLIRIPVAVDDEGALLCVGEVPEGALLTVARAIAPGHMDTVNHLCAAYTGLQAQGGLFHYCAGRRMHLGGEAAQQEVQHAAQQWPTSPLVGALTLGEIGQAAEGGGYPLFHNAALVALPLDTAA